MELIGGIEKRDIHIVDYDPAWSQRFATEHARIARALGATARRIDHIGSTSVPGLAAKPIVDIDLCVPDVEDEGAYLPPLLAAGYQLRVREPGHRMVRTPQRDVHVHIVTVGSDWEHRQLLFRDWLRHDSRDRIAYEQLKRRLAQQNWADMNDYADAKGPLIAEIIQRAQAWAESIDWTPEEPASPTLGDK
ncbi:GrpB family protein [Nocardia sp. CS682]|uniref:GrpB family protein n=1 Tax=Nocardia sp. CS682 TaxID=1047172 RepID=UPI0019816D2F|nr:GrpB family protein [Nocardia sp. CS682]